MNWINVQTRVPENRRRVLAWGLRYRAFSKSSKPEFLGDTRFNPSPHGGTFDVENFAGFALSGPRVTHWAEIEGPTS